MPTTLSNGNRGPDVLELATILVQLGCLDEIKDTFDDEVRRAVRLFQVHNLDPRGRPLAVDGVVGPVTWWALEHEDQSHLFERPVPDNFCELPAEGGSRMGRAALQVAIDEMTAGAREIGGDNAGPFVAKYHRKSEATINRYRWNWCAAFVSWCYPTRSGFMEHLAIA